MSDKPTKKAGVSENSEESTFTVDEIYSQIDQKVTNFTKDFINFLPKSDQTVVLSQIIVDRLLTVKESAKLLVNNYVVSISKEAAKTEEKTND